MFTRPDNTYNDIREKSLMQWLDEMEQHSDVAVRGGVKLTREYVQHLQEEIRRLEEENQLKAQYLKKMGGIIMIASIIIWFLGYYPNHDAYETVAEQQENSYIGQLGRGIEPVIKPLGFDWKLGIGLLSGVGAKELVVSTLGVLYADDPDADSVSLAERIPITPLVAFCYMLFVLIYLRRWRLSNRNRVVGNGRFLLPAIQRH